MIETSEKNIHWDYYLALEKDIESIARYIEFHEDNFDTYSIELAHLLLSASAEVDVVMKLLCNLKFPQLKSENINYYRKIIKKNFQGIINNKVVSSMYGLTLSPWSSWEGESNPTWWQSYNKVKHERSIYFAKANLKNVLNSVAGLLVVNIHYNHEKFCTERKDYPYDLRHSVSHLRPSSSLFRLDDPFLYFVE